MNVTADIVTNVETKRGAPGQYNKRDYASQRTTDCFPFATPRWEDIRFPLRKTAPGRRSRGGFRNKLGYRPTHAKLSSISALPSSRGPTPGCQRSHNAQGPTRCGTPSTPQRTSARTASHNVRGPRPAREEVAEGEASRPPWAGWR